MHEALLPAVPRTDSNVIGVICGPSPREESRARSGKARAPTACNDRGMRFSRFSIRICRRCIKLARWREDRKREKGTKRRRKRERKPTARKKNRRRRRRASQNRLFVAAVSHGTFHSAAFFAPRHPPPDTLSERGEKIAHAAYRTARTRRRRGQGRERRFIWILLGCLHAMCAFLHSADGSLRRKGSARARALRLAAFSFGLLANIGREIRGNAPRDAPFPCLAGDLRMFG